MQVIWFTKQVFPSEIKVYSVQNMLRCSVDLLMIDWINEDKYYQGRVQRTLKSTTKKCLFSQLLLHPSWCNRPEKIVGLLMSMVCGRKKDGAFIKLEEKIITADVWSSWPWAGEVMRTRRFRAVELRWVLSQGYGETLASLMSQSICCFALASVLAFQDMTGEGLGRG